MAAQSGARRDPDAMPAWVRAKSTWVNYAVNGPVPVDDVGVYLVADFHDVLTWCDDDQWRISERRIVPVFRDPAGADPGDGRPLPSPAAVTWPYQIGSGPRPTGASHDVSISSPMVTIGNG